MILFDQCCFAFFCLAKHGVCQLINEYDKAIKRLHLQPFPVFFFQKIELWTHLLPALFFLARRRQFARFFFSFFARSRLFSVAAIRAILLVSETSTKSP